MTSYPKSRILSARPKMAHFSLAVTDDRRNFKLMAFFQRFSLKARQGVQHVVMDMNAAYASMVPKVFPNAKILIDHFHIIQQISQAFNHQRIRT